MSIKDYQILNKLGSGSFGIVYKAKEKSTSTIIVIKQIQISKLDARLKKWAMNEAKLMKQINSDYIVKYFNSFLEKNKLFIAMEFCPKGDLALYIKHQMGKPLKQQTIWKFTIQIMVGLRDLHEKKILHRDIKALNIFLDQNYNVRVGDLGVAKTMSTDFTHTIVGTPYYLSPQMCEEKPYNQKTDIWAMGCLIYELCTGKHPFQAQNQAALALKIVMGKYQDIPSNYSKDLRWVVSSCLSVDYKRRPSIGYLLQKPKIIEQAKKLNINLKSHKNQKQKSSSSIENIISGVQTIVKKIQNIEQKQAKEKQNPKKLVPHSNKIPDGGIKIMGQKKYEEKISQQKKVIVPVPQNQFKKSEDKSKLIQPPINKSSSKNNLKISQQKQKNKINKNSSKQKIKAPYVPQAKSNTSNNIKNPMIGKKQSVPVVAKKIIQKQITPVKIEEPILQPILQKKNQQVSNDKKQSSVKKPTPTEHVHRAQQKLSLKRQFNIDDEMNIQQDEEIVLNLSSLDIEKKQSPRSQAELQKMQKRTNFVNKKVQQQVDDDLLMNEFGITPQKKQTLNAFNMTLMNTKSINWDLQSNNGQKTQSLKQTQPNFKGLPTVKVDDEKGDISVLTGDDDDVPQPNQIDMTESQPYHQNLQNQIEDDNQPFKSDSQDDEIKDKKATQKQQQNEEFEDNQDSRYLIENIEAQIQQQAKKSHQQKIEVLSKKLLQNKKRMIYLQTLKSHTQKQYFGHLNAGKYKQIKETINRLQGKNDADEQLDGLIKKLTGGKEQLVMKFLKIINFQFELQLCEKNIKDCQQKIRQFKQKIQNKDFY